MVVTASSMMENPGPRELATIMNLSASGGERVIFGLNADVAKGLAFE